MQRLIKGWLIVIHVLLFGFTPPAVPMEKEKPLTTVPVIEGFEAVGRSLKQVLVPLAVYLVRIRIVCEEAEEQIVLFVGQVPDF